MTGRLADEVLALLWRVRCGEKSKLLRNDALVLSLKIVQQTGGLAAAPVHQQERILKILAASKAQSTGRRKLVLP
jgi:hypothetical protein